MKQTFAKLVMMSLVLASAGSVHAACEVMENGKATPFDGKSLSGLQVEKKSLSALNKEFPDLNAVEKSFKGEVIACTDCVGKFVVCK